jgi:hypothetical protein
VRAKEGRNDMAPDGELSPMDEAAVSMHEMYQSFRRAGFTRTEAVTIIAKVAAEAINAGADEPEEGTGG